MLRTDQNHIDSEINGGCNPIDSETINHHRPGSAQPLLNAQQLQQQQQQDQRTKQVSAAQNSNSNPKKSVMLNLKSGAINSTVEEFEHFSTRFSDTLTQNRRRYQLGILIIAIAFGCFGCFLFGLNFRYLFDTQGCTDSSGECSFLKIVFPFSSFFFYSISV